MLREKHKKKYICILKLDIVTGNSMTLWSFGVLSWIHKDRNMSSFMGLGDCFVMVREEILGLTSNM